MIDSSQKLTIYEALKVILAVGFFIVACSISDSIYVEDLEKSKSATPCEKEQQKEERGNVYKRA